LYSPVALEPHAILLIWIYQKTIFGSIPALLGNLTQITSLDLSYNNFTRSFLASLGNLTQITYLDLSQNNFIGSILASLGNLTQITSLDLSYNNFSGEIQLPLSNFGGFQQPHQTNIFFYFYYFGIISTGLLPSWLLNMPMLSELDLHQNQLVGPLPNSVSGVLNLTTLDLGSNFLNGTLPSWLFSLPSLVTLNLFGNQLSGEIGEFKSNSLEYLSLSGNMLHGSIPRSISKLVNLTYLHLSSNNLSIMLESESFSKLQKLQWLDFSYNKLFVSINNNVTCTMPNLWRLNLSSCNISEFPLFLRTATNLGSLDLSNNRIHGQVPRWLGDVGRDSLWFLDLRNNLLQGPFPTLNFTVLGYFFVSNNKLSEEIPSSICNASSLEVLDLSHNNLNGMIPKCLIHFSSLSVLDLRMNSLNGTIPARFAKGNKLRNLNLNGNQLEGPLPRSLASCRDLQVLDLGNNRINGTFPYWLGSLPNLHVLVLRSNRFHGPIGNPKTKFPFPNLRILDLSTNMFSGPLPGEYFKYLKAMTNVEEGGVKLDYMGEVYYQDSLKVTIKGLDIELERIQTFLTTIDFSKNSFRGEIPKIIGRLKSLKGLNFSHNNLTGYIPSSFGNLTNLEWLDLSSNKLTGEIPTQLVDLSWLEVLNLSQNQLTGHIPTGKQFNTFEDDSYTGNLGLCGYPLSRTCNNHEAKQPPLSTLQQEDNLEPNNGFGWKAVSIGYGCGAIFGMFMGYIMFKIGKPKWLVRMVKLEQHIMLRRLKNNAHRRGGRR
jgi:Leucine-rich repeat (LRR) protein